MYIVHVALLILFDKHVHVISSPPINKGTVEMNM